MKTLLRKLTLLVSFFLTYESQAEALIFDRALVTDLAKAYLSAYFRLQPAQQLELNYEKPTILAAVDGNGRQFIFVSYHTMIDENEGASIVFEHCGTNEIYPSHYGPTPDLRKEIEWFNSADGNKTADFPGGCPPSP